MAPCGEPLPDTSIYLTVAVALVLEELDRLRATETLPTPALLLERLEGRAQDFNLVAGIVAAYLRKPLVAA